MKQWFIEYHDCKPISSYRKKSLGVIISQFELVKKLLIQFEGKNFTSLKR